MCCGAGLQTDAAHEFVLLAVVAVLVAAQHSYQHSYQRFDPTLRDQADVAHEFVARFRAMGEQLKSF